MARPAVLYGLSKLKPPIGSFPNRVRELRLEREWTQAELARRSGVSLRTVGHVERHFAVHMNTRRLLLKAFRVPFERRSEVFPSIHGPAKRAGNFRPHALESVQRPRENSHSSVEIRS